MAALKDVNRPLLGVVLVANLIVYHVLSSVGFSIEKMIASLKGIESLAAPVGVSILTGILNAQLLPVAKERIVFLRWNQTLPGFSAFSVHAQIDSRIDPLRLIELYGDLPTEPIEQNRLWYKLYLTVKSDPSVSQVHREYLFTRDWATMSLLFIGTLAPLAFYQMEAVSASIYFFLLLSQFFLVRNAASNHGVRFVRTVLALKSGEF